MSIRPVNISASSINDEGGFDRVPSEVKNNQPINKRQFSFSQYWPNVIEGEGTYELSMGRMKNKVIAYNVYASGYREVFRYNSTPVIRVTSNNFYTPDTDKGLFPFMSDDD